MLSLNTKIRDITGKKVNSSLRKKGLIPAVLYGHGIKNKNLSVEYPSFEKIYQEAGESSLIDLIIDKGKPTKVLIQEVALNPVTGRFLHIDFHQVKMAEKVKAEIILEFIGESPAVKEKSGVLVKNLDRIEIECLPADLVHEIKVDLSVLKDFNDLIHIKDLNIPEKIKVLASPETVVATIEEPRKEEVIEEKPKEAEKEVEEAKAEGVKGKTEEEKEEKEKGASKTNNK